MTSKEYLKSGAMFCPVCRSKNIDGGSLNADCLSVWNEITCNDCGATWLDVYELKGYEQLKEGKKE